MCTVHVPCIRHATRILLCSCKIEKYVLLVQRQVPNFNCSLEGAFVFATFHMPYVLQAHVSMLTSEQIDLVISILW